MGKSTTPNKRERQRAARGDRKRQRAAFAAMPAQELLDLAVDGVAIPPTPFEPGPGASFTVIGAVGDDAPDGAEDLVDTFPDDIAVTTRTVTFVSVRRGSKAEKVLEAAGAAEVIEDLLGEEVTER